MDNEKQPVPQANIMPPQEDADFQERVNKFKEEFIPLLGKYEMGIGAQAQINQDGRIIALPVFFSGRKKIEQTKTEEQKPEVKLDNPES